MAERRWAVRFLNDEDNSTHDCSKRTRCPLDRAGFDSLTADIFSFYFFECLLSKCRHLKAETHNIHCGCSTDNHWDLGWIFSSIVIKESSAVPLTKVLPHNVFSHTHIGTPSMRVCVFMFFFILWFRFSSPFSVCVPCILSLLTICGRPAFGIVRLYRVFSSPRFDYRYPF